MKNMTTIHATVKRKDVDVLMKCPDLIIQISKEFIVQHTLYAQIIMAIKTDEREVKECQ